MTRTAPRVVLVTGMSGAGRSSGLRILEDLGYEAIDNLPTSLLERLLHPGAAGSEADRRPLAIDVDIRSRGFREGALRDRLEPLRRRRDIDLSVAFFDCDDEVLRQRFTETRRRHPLAEDRPLMDGIRRERELLATLRDGADLLVDTSNLSLPGLRDLLHGNFRLEAGLRARPFGNLLRLSPRPAAARPTSCSMVRFLANPHYREAFAAAHRTRAAGRRLHPPADPAFRPFIDQLARFLRHAVAALRARGQDLPDNRHRLHRRAPPLGLRRRARRRDARR